MIFLNERVMPRNEERFHEPGNDFRAWRMMSQIGDCPQPGQAGTQKAGMSDSRISHLDSWKIGWRLQPARQSRQLNSKFFQKVAEYYD